MAGCTLQLGPLCGVLRLLAAKGGVERVGHLIGLKEPWGYRVAAYYAVENLEGSPHGFTADPLDVIAAHKAAWALGLDVVGVYHTHPCGEPRPSQRDLRGMRMWPLAWVIGGRGGALAAYRLAGGVVEVCRLSCGGLDQPLQG
ncbi:MAG: M67 family metallopeptidase [Desulfurococcales archaeon]|nr:M67 family metallopeptidase [Desulfurococcales archaeon]